MKGQQGFVQVGEVSFSASAWHRWVLSRGVAIARRLARWHQLGQERHALAVLSDAGLKDLGLSRADIYEESERPFWDDPLKK